MLEHCFIPLQNLQWGIYLQQNIWSADSDPLGPLETWIVSPKNKDFSRNVRIQRFRVLSYCNRFCFRVIILNEWISVFTRKRANNSGIPLVMIRQRIAFIDNVEVYIAKLCLFFYCILDKKKKRAIFKSLILLKNLRFRRMKIADVLNHIIVHEVLWEAMVAIGYISWHVSKNERPWEVTCCDKQTQSPHTVSTQNQTRH